MIIPPIKIDLTIDEIVAVDDLLVQCANHVLGQRSHVRIEVIILAEFAEPWLKHCQSFKLCPDKSKGTKKCRLPVSVAKVLWLRLQHSKADWANQSLLHKLDSQLTNRGQKPYFENLRLFQENVSH